MTALARITENSLLSDEEISRAMQVMIAVREELPTAQPAQLWEIRGWAAAAAAMAAAKKAHQLAIEAGVTQVLAEREIGTLLLEWDKRPKAQRSHPFGGMAPQLITTCKKVARIPEDLFQSELERARLHSKSVSSNWIYRASRYASLQRVEAGISQAFDGSCYVILRYTPPRWRRDLTEARELVAELSGLKADWANGRMHRTLDDLYARSRQLGQAINLCDRGSSRELKRVLGEAELAQMKVSEKLAQAHALAQLEQS